MDVYSIAEKILERIPTGLSKLEQARFVYIELGKLVSFDEEYKLGTLPGIVAAIEGTDAETLKDVLNKLCDRIEDMEEE